MNDECYSGKSPALRELIAMLSEFTATPNDLGA